MASMDHNQESSSSPTFQQAISHVAEQYNSHPAQDAVFTTYELVENILANLQAPDLLLATAVCKPWQTIIVRSKTTPERLEIAHKQIFGGIEGHLHCFSTHTERFLIRCFQDLEIICAVPRSLPDNTVTLVKAKYRSIKFTSVLVTKLAIILEDRESGEISRQTTRDMDDETMCYIEKYHMTAAKREERARYIERQEVLIREVFDGRGRYGRKRNANSA
jgi:hypothetical protein